MALIVALVAMAPAVVSRALTSSITTGAPVDDLAPAVRVAGDPVVCRADVPADLGFDPFYRQSCEALGIHVLASAAVDPAAVRRTAEIMVAMIGHRSDVVESMIARELRVAVMATDEVTTDMPEHSDLYELFPGTDWDTRARGLGATSAIPLSSVGEENILCLPGDPYAGGSIMVHEFAHTVLNLGLRVVEPDLDARLTRAWNDARDDGLWADTYAITNPDEYWAEAVMSYFDTNIDGPPGGDGIHNDIDTRAELAVYDPDVFTLIDSVFADAAPLGLCNG